MQRAFAVLLVVVLMLAGCTAGPETPVVLSSPVNGSVVPTLSPVLTWGGGGGSTIYRVLLATDSNFQNIISDINNLREPSYAIPQGRLDNDTTYWWKVLAKDQNSTSTWTEPWYFKTPGGSSPSEKGIIRISATLDGQPWSGNVNYAISGPFSDTDNSLPWNFNNMEPGNYTVTYNYGGPDGATLGSISPAPTQELSEGGTIRFTLNFYSKVSSSIQVNATLNGSPWSGSISYSLSGPQSNSDVSVPRTYSGLAPGSYTLTYNSGGPQGAILNGISPSATQSLSSSGNLVYTFIFTTGQSSSLSVSATLDGKPWSGPINFTIEGAISTSQGSVPFNINNAPSGTYTLKYNGGGPSGATFGGVLPASTIQVIAGRSANFVLNFNTTQQVGNITVNGFLDGTPWSGTVHYFISGPFQTSDVAVPRTYPGVPAGSYSITYTGGGPANATLVNITPSPSQVLQGARTIAFNFNFVSQPTSGTISVNAMLDGKPWSVAIGSGSISYTVNGPRGYSSNTVPAQFTDAPSGTYTLTYNSGGPIGATLTGISPSPSQVLPSGGTIQFTLMFTSQARGQVTVNATLDGKPWSGQVGYTVTGPYVESGSNVPRTFSNAPSGTYTVNYSVGGPPDANFDGVSPPSQVLDAGGNIEFTLMFTSIPIPTPVPEPSPFITPVPEPPLPPVPEPTTPVPEPGPLVK